MAVFKKQVMTQFQDRRSLSIYGPPDWGGPMRRLPREVQMGSGHTRTHRSSAFNVESKMDIWDPAIWWLTLGVYEWRPRGRLAGYIALLGSQVPPGHDNTTFHR